MLGLLVLLLVALVSGSTVTDTDYTISNEYVSGEDQDMMAELPLEESYEMFRNLMPDMTSPHKQSTTDPATLAAERKLAMRVYEKTLAEVRENNRLYALGEVSYKLVINSFAVMTDGNRRMYHGLGVNSVNHTDSVFGGDIPDVNSGRNEGDCPDDMHWGNGGCEYNSGVGDGAELSASTSIDWRSNLVGIKNQGTCGSCWTFPATALLEHAYKVCTGRTVALSEQELLDCTYEHMNYNGCGGGWYYQAWKWIKDQRNHIASQGDYPYRNRDSACQARHYDSAIKDRVRLDSWFKVAPSSIINEMQKQPLAVAFFVANAFHSIGGGIFNSYCVGQSNHAVTLTGYGPGYWEIRNSWGINWGNRGYSKFRRSGLNSICNLLDSAMAIRWTDLNGDDGGDDGGNDGGDDEKGGKCQDFEDGCSEWANDGYCKDAKYMEWMTTNCAKSCQKCGCTDIDERCDYFLDQNYCTVGEWIDWMAKNCQRTCDKCDKTDPDPNPDPDNCSDTEEYATSCGGWAEDKYCKKGHEFYDFMKNNCKKSCDMCGDDGGDEDKRNKDEKELVYSAVQQSSTSSDAKKAVDKKDDTKSQTSCSKKKAKNTAWFSFEVEASPGKVVKVTRVEILGFHFDGRVKGGKRKMLSKLNGAKVKVGSQTCGSVTVNKKTGSKADQTYSINCGSSGIKGTTVKIEQSTRSYKNRNCLDLNEVRVFGIISGGDDDGGDGGDDDDIDRQNEKCKKKTGCNCGLKMCGGICKHEHMCY